MAVTVWVPPLLRNHSLGREELLARGGSLTEVLAGLGAVGTEVLSLLRHSSDKGPAILSLFLNGSPLADAADLMIDVQDGDDLAIVPVIRGGW